VSKFDRLFRVAKTDEGEEPVTETPPTPPQPLPAPAPSRPPKPKRESPAVAKTSPKASSKSKEQAKISGKRQHPDFVGLTTYIRKEVHRRVKIALLVEGQNRELSELVDELLAAWLAKKEK
jgi:hypothetical protein